MKKKVEQVIIDAITEINEERDEKFEINESLTLIGNSGVLDSMDLVNLTVEIEEKLSDQLDIEITIASDKAFSRKKSPFYNISSLTDFILELTEVK